VTRTFTNTGGVENSLEAKTDLDSTKVGLLELHASNPVFGVPGLSRSRIENRSSITARSKVGVTTRVKRKFQGILVCFFGDEAAVMFEDKGEKVEYRLPADLLRKNGITVADQPFELIESEITENGAFSLHSKVVPLAPASSGTVEPLALTKAYRAKRDFLLKKSKERGS
jgi:hypothetical protein